MLVSGTLGERWGRRRTVVVGYAAYVLASVACVLAPHARVVPGGAGAAGRGQRVHHTAAARRARQLGPAGSGWGGRWAGSGRCRRRARPRRLCSVGWPRSWTGGWRSSGSRWWLSARRGRHPAAATRPGAARHRLRTALRPVGAADGAGGGAGVGVPVRAGLPGGAAAGGGFRARRRGSAGWC